MIIIEWLKKVLKKIKKFQRDLISTLYDSDGCMSWPRVACFISFFSIIIAWLLEQCARLTFEHFEYLVGLYAASMTGYVGKKISERGAHDAKDK